MTNMFVAFTRRYNYSCSLAIMQMLDNLLKAFFNVTQGLVADGSLLAYHDVSDGGLFTTVTEMAFAGKTGVSINLDSLVGNDIAVLFNEELGGVIQVLESDMDAVNAVLTEFGLTELTNSRPKINESFKTSNPSKTSFLSS